MKALTKLKDDARKHEQKEEWDKAIQLYLDVIRSAEESEGDSELPLYNRVGDLFVRMSRPSDAVSYYEKAADRYAEAGLFNNAIALCNKALRYLPNRTELLRKLGQFSASQGFITEARRWYLEYAERKLKEGALDEAFQALDDFASVHEDADVREMLGRQLLAHNRREHAVQELKKAHELRVAAGQSDASVRLMDEILTIDSGAFSTNPEQPAPPQEPQEPAAYDAPQIDSWMPPAAMEAGPAEPLELVPDTPADAFGLESPTDAGLIDLSSLPGFETAEPSLPAAQEPLDLPATEPLEPPATVPFESPNVESFELPAVEPFELSGAEMFELPAAESVELPATEPPLDSFDVPLVDLDAALADINAEIASAQPDPADASLTPIDLDIIDLSGGGDDLDVGVVDIGAAGLEPTTPDIDDARNEALPLIDTGALEENDTFELPLLEDPREFETIDTFGDADFEASFDSEPVEPLPLLGEEDEEQQASEPPPDVAFDGPVVEPGPAEAEPAFEIETPQPDISGFEHAQDTFSTAQVPEPASESAAYDDTPFELEEAPPADAEISAFDLPQAEDTGPVAFDFEPAETADAVQFEVERPESEEPADIPVETQNAASFEAADEVEAESAGDYDALTATPENGPNLDIEYDFEEEEAFEPDWTETLAAAQDFARRGETAAAAEELLILHEGLAANGMYREALQVIDELVRLEPGSVGHLQQRVEYATKAGDTGSLVHAYLDLADRLARSGSTVKANAIYQRVLDLDPTNATARNAVYTPPPPVQTNSDGYVDLFALLSDDEEEGTRFVVEEKAPTGDEERDFADMLTQFKQKLADHVPFDDSSSHYDLGLAFKEMGLIDEAIAEFQIALKGGQDRLKIYEELGQCFLLKQQYNIAITILNRALNMGADEGDLVGVYYHIGRSYEEMGQRVEAKTAYERVVGVDISFKDAAERLARL